MNLKINQTKKSVAKPMFLLVFFGLGFVASQAQVQTNGSLFIGPSGTIHLGVDVKTSQETRKSGAYGKLILGSGSMTTAATNANFLQGFGSISTTKAFMIPLGQADVYAPVQLTPTTEAFVDAAYFRTNATSIGAKLDDTVTAISKNEYWNIKGSNSAIVSLTWRASSDLVNMGLGATIENLSIVAFDKNTAKWVVIPSTIDGFSILGEVSSANKGSITSNNAIDLSAYEHFSLGAVDSNAKALGLLANVPSQNRVVATISNNSISFKANQPLSYYEVFDLAGRKITASNIENQLNYTAPFIFPTAVYIVKATLQNGSIANFKLTNQN